ncbi:MAG: class I SAM-dependent methyltransferase [Burkholderiales bacterium]
MTAHSIEVEAGQRFEFGKNWQRFLDTLTPARIATAEESIRRTLGVDSLQGKRFLDIGSGSGLFSLSARRLGAEVVSFDFDPQSVACTSSLRERFFRGDPAWRIEESSVLDEVYMASHRGYDVVYSWGVLHHTGAMWQAIANAMQTVGPGGTFVISIYNDQGPWSRRWKKLKQIYNRLPRFLQPGYTVLVMGARELPAIVSSIVRLRPLDYIKRYTGYYQQRGMGRWRDMVDWIGGYPFEVAKPEEVFDFFRQRGFELLALKTCAGGLGCNEFVFRRGVDTGPAD